MVFILEEIARIESDRRIQHDLNETRVHVQASEFFKDTDTFRVIDSMLENYVNYAQHYVWDGSIISILGVFTDAFLNAGMWGNQNTPKKKITVQLKYGILGSVIYIADEGEGFDYLTEIGKVQRGEKHTCHHNGGGLRKFHESNLHIAYHGKGNVISIATPVFTQEEVNRFLERSRRT